MQYKKLDKLLGPTHIHIRLHPVLFSFPNRFLVFFIQILCLLDCIIYRSDMIDTYIRRSMDINI